MVNVKGEDILSSRETDEFLMVYPDSYYYCEFKTFEYLNKTIILIKPDSEYAFYDLDLWEDDRDELYSKNAIYAVFEHPILNNINVDDVVLSGQARVVNYHEYRALMGPLESSGMIRVKTNINNRDTLIYKELMKQRSIEIQMTLSRIVPEYKLAKEIEETMRLLEGVNL